MNDAFGTLLVLIRDDAAVAAIVAGRVSAVAEAPPSVRLQAMPTTREPFGPGSGRLGLQLARFIAQCYGTNDPTGQILARQLAGAVSDAVHLRGPIAGSAYVARAYAAEIGEALRDPDTLQPYHTVRIEAYAAAQAVT